jgi:hypothetical protein
VPIETNCIRRRVELRKEVELEEKKPRLLKVKRKTKNNFVSKQ